MENLLTLDWGELFAFSVSPLEIVVRGTAMYWFLFLIFRFVVRRDVGAVGLADVLILVIVADAAQNGMAGDYKSVSEGMLLVATLIGWNVALDWLSFRFKWFRRFAEPPPIMLARDGKLLKRNLRLELLTEEELWSQLREQGIESLDEVRCVYMEPDGQISVIKKKGKKQD
jgi:uncharacterized membrane protein YcaP (DUF421 family)